MSEKHTGLRISLDKYLNTLYLDSGRKYDRYMGIAFLKSNNNYPPCVVVGNLEISKEEQGKEFFNPCKFNDPDKLFSAILHLLATYIAYNALLRGVSVREIFVPFVRKLQYDKRIHDQLVNLAENYYKKMKEIEYGE